MRPWLFGGPRFLGPSKIFFFLSMFLFLCPEFFSCSPNPGSQFSFLALLHLVAFFFVYMNSPDVELGTWEHEII
jgi:hypothetical protein